MQFNLLIAIKKNSLIFLYFYLKLPLDSSHSTSLIFQHLFHDNSSFDLLLMACNSFNLHENARDEKMFFDCDSRWRNFECDCVHFSTARRKKSWNRVPRHPACFKRGPGWEQRGSLNGTRTRMNSEQMRRRE